jgi:hypothetical protein
MMCLSVILRFLRVTHEYVDPMLRVLLVLALRLEDELLEDVIISGNNTVKEICK